MRDVIENGPGLDVVPEVLDLVVVDSVEEEGERLEVHQGGHHPVDAEDLGTRVARLLEHSVSKHGKPYLLSAILSEDEDPEAAGEEEEDGQHLVERGQRHLAGGQVAVGVLLLDLDGEGHGVLPGAAAPHPGVVEAVVEEHAVQTLQLLVEDVDVEGGLVVAILVSFQRYLDDCLCWLRCGRCNFLHPLFVDWARVDCRLDSLSCYRFGV